MQATFTIEHSVTDPFELRAFAEAVADLMQRFGLKRSDKPARPAMPVPMIDDAEADNEPAEGTEAVSSFTRPMDHDADGAAPEKPKRKRRTKAEIAADEAAAAAAAAGTTEAAPVQPAPVASPPASPAPTTTALSDMWGDETPAAAAPAPAPAPSVPTGSVEPKTGEDVRNAIMMMLSASGPSALKPFLDAHGLATTDEAINPRPGETPEAAALRFGQLVAAAEVRLAQIKAEKAASKAAK